MSGKYCNLLEPYRGMTRRQAAKAAKIRAKKFGGYVTFTPKPLASEKQRDPCVQLVIDIYTSISSKISKIMTPSEEKVAKKPILDVVSEAFASTIDSVNGNTISETDIAQLRMYQQMRKNSKILSFLKAPVEDLSAESMLSLVA